LHEDESAPKRERRRESDLKARRQDPSARRPTSPGAQATLSAQPTALIRRSLCSKLQFNLEAIPSGTRRTLYHIFINIVNATVPCAFRQLDIVVLIQFVGSDVLKSRLTQLHPNAIEVLLIIEYHSTPGDVMHRIERHTRFTPKLINNRISSFQSLAYGPRNLRGMSPRVDLERIENV
jgi:hypothetical protein